MSEIGKILIIGGCVMILAGLMLWTGIGKSWFGRLPGDIHYTKENFSFHFPLMTCLIISVVLTLLSWFFRKR